MIADPYLLHHIVTANAEIATAMENVSSDMPDYDELHNILTTISKQIEALIVREVTR